MNVLSEKRQSMASGEETCRGSDIPRTRKLRAWAGFLVSVAILSLQGSLLFQTERQ